MNNFRLFSKVEELKADQLPVAEQAKSSLGIIFILID